MRITFLIASARGDGNSELLAKRAAANLSADCEQKWIALREHPLDPFADIRHAEADYGPVDGNAGMLLDATLWATDLVFVSPVYWYSVPAALKLYLDHWSHWMRIDGLDFKSRMSEKAAWAISCSAGAASEAEAMLQTLRLSAKYLAMTWRGHVLGNGSAPGDVLQDTAAVGAAERLFATP